MIYRLLAVCTGLSLLVVPALSGGAPRYKIDYCALSTTPVSDVVALSYITQTLGPHAPVTPVLTRATSLSTDFSGASTRSSTGSVQIYLAPTEPLSTLAHELAHVKWYMVPTSDSLRLLTQHVLNTPQAPATVTSALYSIRAVYTGSRAPLDSLLSKWEAQSAAIPSSAAAPQAQHMLLALLKADTAFKNSLTAKATGQRLAFAALSLRAGSIAGILPGAWSAEDELSGWLATEINAYNTTERLAQSCLEPPYRQQPTQ